MRIQHLLATSALLLALAPLAGCGLPGSSTSGATQGKLDTCALLSNADVATAIGEAVKDGQPGLSNEGDANTATFSECRYPLASDPDGVRKVSVFVRRSPVNDNTPAAIDQVRQSMRDNFNAKLTNISGIGDTAFWAVYFSGRQLHVFKGANLYLFVTMPSIFPDNAATLAKAKALAQKTLDKLAL